MKRACIACLSILLLTAPSARALYSETWVEPAVVDCTGTPRPIHPQVTGSAGNVDLDNDGRYDAFTVLSLDENADSDAVYKDIATALTNTATGGTIHLVSGVYREQITITDSVYIRGPLNGDAIFEGECLSGTTKAIDINATGKTVVLENISIHGFTTGVDMGESTLTMINCRVRACGIGILVNVTDGLHFYKGEITHCTDGIFSYGAGAAHLEGTMLAENVDAIDLDSGGAIVVSLASCHVVRNSGVGVSVTGTCHLDVHDTEISNNGARGIDYASTTGGTFRVTDSAVASNGSDGIYMRNTQACANPGYNPLRGILAHSRVTGNVGDGVETFTTTGCTFPLLPPATTLSVFQNTVAQNGGYGLNGNNGGGFACTLGQNQISYNVSGAEFGTAVCTAAGSSSNSVP